MAKAYIFLANGFEDMEALATRDVLIRGGVETFTVSITDEGFVESSHGVTVLADMSFESYIELAREKDDVMIFPGGMPGTKNLAGCVPLMERMKDHYANGGTVAAICAAPGLVVSQLEGLEGKRFTCFEGFQEPMIGRGAVYTPESVVVDGRLITGRGAGHAINFGLSILSYLKGAESAEKIKGGLML